MDAQTVGLVLTGAVLHATWNTVFKRAAGGGLPLVWLTGLVSMLATAPFGIWVFARLSAPLGMAEGPCVLASTLIHIAYTLALQHGYRVGDFSLVYPLARGTGPACAVIGAVIFMGESPSLFGWLGCVFISLGVMLLARGGTAASDTANSKAGRYQGITWGLFTGVCISAYTVMDGWAIKRLGLSPVLYYGSGLFLRSLFLAPWAVRDLPCLRSLWSDYWGCILIVGLLSPLAYWLILSALQRAPLYSVAPLREMAMLIGVVFAALFLHEKFGPARWLGAVAMMLGAMAIASGQ